ncbi:hypothetical protein CC80DRAFT_504026 [Byssothecium circinans]|uniref:Uncharacterized protein n=1 Tax=Byssothecium circinans TaxID=147558 RepID=A0A6A5U718_9PLEO|nr:hypothetical protein CC80DRAFT_504026 [Byssothecium circinans]
MPEGMQSDAGTELSWSASPTLGPSRPPRATASSVAEDQETLRQLELEHEAVNATDSMPNGKLRFVREVITQRRNACLENREEPFEHKENTLKALFLREMNRPLLEIEAEDAASECKPHTKKPQGLGRDQNNHVKLRRHGALNYALADRMIEHSREQQRKFLGVFRELFSREQEAGGSAAPLVKVEWRIGALEERLKEQK